jgi:hypothetical protein
MLRVAVALAFLLGCGDDAGAPDAGPAPVDPDTAERALIDRFSAEAATMMVRDDGNGLPGPGEPIDLDQQPFITQSLGPDGQVVRYYNLDAQARLPPSMYVFYRDGEPLAGQLPIVDVVPGDDAYSDFFTITRVTAPATYVANTITSVEQLAAAGLATESTDVIVNRPLVPEGSTALERVGDQDPAPQMAWYRGSVAHYLSFGESDLRAIPDGEIFAGMVPLSYIFVTFNIDPGEPGGGPPSGFKTEPGTDQTHNVVETIPGDTDPVYSPLWHVVIYDNDEFDQVSDLDSARAATRLEIVDPKVNCPIVYVESP